MSVATANPVLLTDGDAAFLRVNSRLPSHALEPGTAASARNIRFEQGQARPRLGLATDLWGQPYGLLGKSIQWGYTDPAGIGIIPVLPTNWPDGTRIRLASTETLPTTPTALFADTDYYVSSGPLFYRLHQTRADALAVANAITVGQGSGTLTVIAYGPNTCAYLRYSDPTTNTDNAILIVDEDRDRAGQDGGKGRAWRILSGNGPQEIPLNGHDVWGQCRLVQCDLGLMLLRATDGANQRYYLDVATAFADATNDRIQFNVTPPWPLNTGRRVRFEWASSAVSINGTAAPAPSNYYYAKHLATDLVELYTDPGLTNKLDWSATGLAGRIYFEEAIDPIPYFGNGARNLLMQPGPDGETPFDMGFDTLLENVEITGTEAATDILTAPNHRLQPGDSVSGTAITGVTWPAYAAPLGLHTLKLYRTQDQAMIAPDNVAFTNTTAATDLVTVGSTADFSSGDPAGVTGITGITAGTVKFVNVVSATTLKLYDTAANAVAGGATGLFNLTVDAEAGTLALALDLSVDGQTGSLWKTSAAAVPLPPCREGWYENGRFIAITGADLVVISDPYDFLHTTVFASTVPANQGESGQANWIRPMGDNVIAVGKDLKVLGIAGLSNTSPDNWSERTITSEYNGLAPLAAVPIGSDIWFASRKGFASIVRTVAGETLGVSRPVSRDIPDDLNAIDWAKARLMCAETWNNRLFWAVPTRSQAAPARNNRLLVYNFTNQNLRVRQDIAAGDVVGGAYEETSVFNDSWEGYWDGDLLTPHSFARLTVNGEERLTFATPDGMVLWFHEGWDDVGAEISSELLTRAYFGGRPVLVLKGKLNWDTYRPKLTASLVMAGVSEEETLSGLEEKEYDRTEYTVDGRGTYDPNTSTPETFDASHRADYSPDATELLAARLDVHQNTTEAIRARTRGTAPQIRLQNTQGSARFAVVSLQARPVGVRATRET